MNKKYTTVQWTMIWSVGMSLMLSIATTLLHPSPAPAATAEEIDRNVDNALKTLWNRTPEARWLMQNAKAVLVFPGIVKAGFLLGGQYGEGALRVNGKTAGYYSSTAASYGLQAGVQVFGYALFFMSGSALSYLDNSEGWELGVGPSIVIVEMGAGTALTTTTVRDEIYAFIFSQKGLMAGLGLQGSKITKISP